MDVRVLAVAAHADDRLIVSGTVDGVPVLAQGWVSWTQNFYRPEDHPGELTLPEGLTDDERSTFVEAHRAEILAIRRPMTQKELRDYCEQLLLETVGVPSSGTDLPVQPLLDEA